MPEPSNKCAVIAIPARLQSTRLPNKLLLNATGRPLLAHVIDQCKEAVDLAPDLFSDIVVAGDCNDLVDIARAAGVRGVLTGTHHQCGTTRIAEALENASFDHEIQFVVNVQGDEPELAPNAIVRVAEMLADDPAADMATLALAMFDDAEKSNPNAVKVVFDDSGRALFFSRAPIPFDQSPPAEGEPHWFHHLGIYAYRRSFLTAFAQMPPCSLEVRERLEQLRALNAGKTIKVAAVPAEWAAKGIDTQADYDAFVKRAA